MIRIGNHLTPYLLLACIALAGGLYQQTRDNGAAPQTSPRSDIQAPAKNEPATRPDFAAPPLMGFQEISRRPLFLSERKPPPPPERPVIQRQAAPVRPLGLILEGIVVTDEEKAAMVVNISNSEVLQLSIGMQHLGWELFEVTPSSASFRQGEQTQELTLEE